MTPQHGSVQKQECSNGLLEGISRGASQACVYILEFQKTQLQVYGRLPSFTAAEWLHNISKGVVSSAITAGIVYATYFSVYNSIADKVIGGIMATVATSVIKIPIANSMRVLQSGNLPHVFSAAGSILKAQGMRGLYSGYGLSLIDDYIDMECRLRIYKHLRSLVPEGNMNQQMGLIMGAISGSIAAAITTPFDTIRCHMAVSSTHAIQRSSLRTIHGMYIVGGLPIFLRGLGYRASSNAVRTALFYMFYEVLLIHENKEKKQKPKQTKLELA
jgi:hypothetical protein